MTHPHSSNGLFTEVTDKLQQITTGLTDFAASCETAEPEDLMNRNLEMNRLSAQTTEVLHLVQAIVFKVTPARRDTLLARLREILAASEAAKQAHMNLTIRVYGPDAAALIAALADQLAQDD